MNEDESTLKSKGGYNRRGHNVKCKEMTMTRMQVQRWQMMNDDNDDDDDDVGTS